MSDASRSKGVSLAKGPIGLIGLALLAAGVAMYVTERLRLECLAPTSYVDRGDGRRAGSIGFPFLAGGSLRTGRFAFCKTNPPPGENAARFGNREPPPLSPQCAHTEALRARPPPGAQPSPSSPSAPGWPLR